MTVAQTGVFPATRSEKARQLILQARLSTLFWSAIFVMLFFAPGIQSSTGFSYIDEAAVILLAGAALLKAVRERDASRGASRSSLRSVSLLGLLLALGLAGNAIWGIQTNPVPIFIDIFTCFKFPLTVLLSCYLFERRGDLFPMVEAAVKILVAVMLFLAIVNLVADVGMGVNPRYGLRASFMFVLGHPTFVVFGCVGAVVILLVNRDKNKKWIVAALLVAALSLRSKGLVFVALVLFLLVTVGRKGRITFAHILPCILLAVVIGYDQFDYYFISNDFARGEITRASFEVARDYFPLGTGFATFGSNVTSELGYYSPLYFEYGLSNVYGLSLQNPSFLSDTFWPTVIGQFGSIGLAIYLLAMCSIAVSLRRMEGPGGLSVFCCFAYLLISSTSESACFNPQAVFLAFCLALAASASASRHSSGSASPACNTIRRAA